MRMLKFNLKNYWHEKICSEHKIPVTLSEFHFNEFILPAHKRGRPYKISRHKIFGYVMIVLYTGCQWKMLPIERSVITRCSKFISSG